MSRLSDHEGGKVRLPGHGVTEIKPQGLLAVRPPQSTIQKPKEGVHQSQQEMTAKGCIISTEMVKALKSALMDAGTAYRGQKELSKKTVCSKSRLPQKSSVQPNGSQQPKCVTSGLNKKTTLNNNCTNISKKKVSNVATKMEMIKQMNMEGVVGPKSSPDSDPSSPPTRHKSQCEMKRRTTETPSQNGKTPPTRRGQRETTCRRKSLIAVPASSPERNKTTSNRVSTNGPTLKKQVSNGVEVRKQLATVSLDRFILSRNKELKSTRAEKIVPDMTSVDFMRKLMSFSAVGFRETRFDRRTAKSPELDTIPEESPSSTGVTF